MRVRRTISTQANSAVASKGCREKISTAPRPRTIEEMVLSWEIQATASTFALRTLPPKVAMPEWQASAPRTSGMASAAPATAPMTSENRPASTSVNAATHAVAARGRERGYRYWRALTTGKSIGIPHDTYGLTLDGQVFGLIPHGVEATELQIDGESEMVTDNTTRIARRIGRRIHASGMTTVNMWWAQTINDRKAMLAVA